MERAPDGQEFAFSGIHQVVRPDRLVRTFVFETMPDNEAVETIVFDEEKSDARR